MMEAGGGPGGGGIYDPSMEQCDTRSIGSGYSPLGGMGGGEGRVRGGGGGKNLASCPRG
jgi:hypothetical protein